MTSCDSVLLPPSSSSGVNILSGNPHSPADLQTQKLPVSCVVVRCTLNDGGLDCIFLQLARVTIEGLPGDGSEIDNRSLRLQSSIALCIVFATWQRTTPFVAN